jgi:phosphomannomutase
MQKTSPIIFDLDGTLTPSRSALEPAMAAQLEKMLAAGYVLVVISGGHFAQYEKQFLSHLNIDESLYANLYLLPTSGSTMRFWNPDTRQWDEQYAHTLTDEQKQHVFDAFETVLAKTDIDIPADTYGERIEDRNTQITFSALGQEAPLSLKKDWDPDRAKRLTLIAELQPLLPDLEIHAGGTTSIDITLPGIDKQYGIEAFFNHTNLDITAGLFIGDAIFPGGNDYAATKTGIATRTVDGPDETLATLEEIYTREQA